MEKHKRYIMLFYAVATVVVIVVMAKFFSAVFAMFNIVDYRVIGSQLTLSRLLALAVSLGLGFYFYFNPRTSTLSLEVAAELEKVTWPSKEEAKAGTYVVIVMVVIMAGVLGFFDFFSSYITGFVQ